MSCRGQSASHPQTVALSTSLRGEIGLPIPILFDLITVAITHQANTIDHHDIDHLLQEHFTLLRTPFRPLKGWMPLFSKSFVLLPQRTKSPPGLCYQYCHCRCCTLCAVISAAHFYLSVYPCMNPPSVIIFHHLPSPPWHVSFLTHDAGLVNGMEEDTRPSSKEADFKHAMQRFPCQVQSNHFYMSSAFNNATSTPCTLQRTKGKKHIARFNLHDEMVLILCVTGDVDISEARVSLTQEQEEIAQLILVDSNVYCNCSSNSVIRKTFLILI